MLLNHKNGTISIILAAVLIFTVSAFNVTAGGEAPDKHPVADVMFSGNSINFLPKVDHAALYLRITGPNGFVLQKIFQGGAAPFVNLNDNGSGFVDGNYRYELRVVPVGPVKLRRGNEADGPALEKNTREHIQPAPMTQSGNFRVLNGMIVDPNAPEPQKTNDVLHYDDVIITGSLCVGFDCADGESFGYDTIRLKEHNLRIHFDDTSYTASYPRNDWRILINDSTNGGASYFRIEDTTGSRNPFTIEAGARSNSLYVDDNGRIGIGTSTPVVELHVVDGDTPALRLEQDGSSGFAAQTWDVAGNESNFFVRDATSGSTLPFRIIPGAPSSSLCINADGDVGVGTYSPDYSFEVERTGAGAQVVATRTDGATMEFSATGSYGIAGTRTDHPLRLRVENHHILQINQTGNYLQVYNNSGSALGNYDGTWNDSSSRELKENIADLTDSEAENALDELNPVKYNYKDQKDEERLGFIAEDVPGIVSHKDGKTLSSMDIIAVLTKVVKKQQKNLEDACNTIKNNKETINQLKAEINDLKKKK